jgi:hypothetical protein
MTSRDSARFIARWEGDVRRYDGAVALDVGALISEPALALRQRREYVEGPHGFGYGALLRALSNGWPDWILAGPPEQFGRHKRRYEPI